MRDQQTGAKGTLAADLTCAVCGKKITYEPDDLLVIAEVAALLRTPVATLHKWRQYGRGPKASKPGIRLLYRYGDVLDWLAAHGDDWNDAA